MQHSRRNENGASELGETFSLSPAEGARARVRRIRLSGEAVWNWRPLQLRARPPSTGSALDGIANSDSGSRSGCVAKFGRPFRLAASRSPSPWPSPAGRGNTASRAATSRGALDSPRSGGRFSLSPGERAGVRGKVALERPMRLRSAIQGRDSRTTQRVRFATQRRAILPLLFPTGEGMYHRSVVYPVDSLVSREN